MLDTIAIYFSEKMLKHEIIKFNELEIYQYGIKITCANLINLLSLVILSLLIDSMLYLVIFFAVFSSLRSYCGGYHANTYQKCFICTLLSCFYVATMSKLFNISLNFYICMSMLMVLIIIKLAPIENIYKPISLKEKKKFKKKALKIFVMWIMIFTLAYKLNFFSIPNTIFWTKLLVIFLMLLK